jgi:hypothetical protein
MSDELEKIESCRALTEALSKHMPEETEANHKNLRIPGVHDKIRTEHLLRPSLENHL